MKRIMAFLLALTVAAGLVFSFAPGAMAAYMELEDIYTEYGLGQTVTVKGRTDISIVVLYLTDPNGLGRIAMTLSGKELMAGYTFAIGRDWVLGPYTMVVGSGADVVNEYHFDVVQDPVNHNASSGNGNRVVATSISVSPASIEIKAGESATVEVTSAESTVKWETDDGDKISITGGKTATITGKRTGTAKAWAYSGNNYATVTVTVLPADREPVGTVTTPGNDGRQPDKTDEPAENGGSQTLPDAFSDLDGVEWAKESINALAAAGIVNGVGGGAFAPERNVTRAEFVKMAVEAFGFEHSGQALEFTDVDGGEWYADVVAIAAENGIVNGYGDGSFLPGNNISCQDAALILSRVAGMKGINMAAPASLPADDGTSEYAREAVSLLRSNGVISDEMGFEPLEKATRAQSAYMIYQIYALGRKNG